MGQAVSELRAKLPEGSLIIGNGLQNYDFNAGLGNPTYELFVDVVDGFSMEHMMAFEVCYSNCSMMMNTWSGS